MAEMAEPLALKDCEGIAQAIMDLIAEYRELPFKPTGKTIQWQNMDTNEGISVFTMTGAVYIKKYISGTFVGQYPFRIMYRCNPTTNAARLKAQTFVEGLAKWLENCSAQAKDEKLDIERIERTSPVWKEQAENSGAEIYTCTMNTRYTQRK